MNVVARIKVIRSRFKSSSILSPVIPLKRAAVKSLIARMLVYSAIKIRANSPLLYSTLKPDTNSDSPSAKSKGVRLVSAKFVINHRMKIGGIININHEY
jgi:hypothetical protein